MTQQQVLQETLQLWLDGLAALHIDILAMDDIPTPSWAKWASNSTSTLFLLEGTSDHLAELWQLTKQLELLPLVSSWEHITTEIEPQVYCSVLAVVLAVSSEQWNFVQEREMSRGEE